MFKQVKKKTNFQNDIQFLYTSSGVRKAQVQAQVLFKSKTHFSFWKLIELRKKYMGNFLWETNHWKDMKYKMRFMGKIKDV